MNRCLISQDGLLTSNWFDADKAEVIKDSKYWDGHNHISNITSSQFHHQWLFVTASGKFVLNSFSDYQGSKDVFEIIDKDQALEWLIKNGSFEDAEKYFPNQAEQFEI